MNKIILLIWIFPLSSSCNNDSSKYENPLKNDSGTNQFYQDSNSIIILEENARRGDSEALDKLINYYLIYSNIDISYNRTELIQWLKLAIIRGSVNHSITFLNIVQKKEDPDCKYIRRSVANIGSEDTVNDLKRSNSLIDECIG